MIDSRNVSRQNLRESRAPDHDRNQGSKFVDGSQGLLSIFAVLSAIERLFEKSYSPRELDAPEMTSIRGARSSVLSYPRTTEYKNCGIGGEGGEDQLPID